MGTVEVIVFPKDYEKNAELLDEDAKVFIKGRVSAEDDRPSKLVCERVWAFRGGSEGALDSVCGPWRISRPESGNSMTFFGLPTEKISVVIIHPLTRKR